MNVSGQKLRRIRESQNVRPSEIARRMNVTQPRVARMESGEKDPEAETAVRYLQAVEDVLAERMNSDPGKVTFRLRRYIEADVPWSAQPIVLLDQTGILTAPPEPICAYPEPES